MVSRPLVVAELERLAARLQQPSVQSAISLAPSAAPTAAVGAAPFATPCLAALLDSDGAPRITAGQLTA